MVSMSGYIRASREYRIITRLAAVMSAQIPAATDASIGIDIGFRRPQRRRPHRFIDREPDQCDCQGAKRGRQPSQRGLALAEQLEPQVQHDAVNRQLAAIHLVVKPRDLGEGRRAGGAP